MQDCDLGEQSILHAVKTKSTPKKCLHDMTPSVIEEGSSSSGCKPLCETLLDFDEEKNKLNGGR